MSFREHLLEKIEEARHNEIITYFIFLAGTVFFIGGILITLSLSSEAEWFLFIPYHSELIIGAVLGSTVIICGISLMSLGIISSIKYARDRNWFLQETRKGNHFQDVFRRKKTPQITEDDLPKIKELLRDEIEMHAREENLLKNETRSES